MLNNSASVVLTSLASENRLASMSPRGMRSGLRGSTYRLGKRLFTQAMGGLGENSLRLAALTLDDRLTDLRLCDLNSSQNMVALP